MFLKKIYLTAMLRKLPFSGAQTKGLAIEALPWEWKEYPVIHLDKPVEEALKQIEDKKYYVPYLEKGLNVFKIGVVFGEKERFANE